MDRVEVLTCSIEDYMSKADSPINKVVFYMKTGVEYPRKHSLF